MRCLGKKTKAVKGRDHCESGRNKHRERAGKRDKSGQSSVYGSAHLLNWALLIKPYFSLQKSCAAQPGQVGMEQEGGWNGGGSEELAGLGASTHGRPQPDGRDRRGPLRLSCLWALFGSVRVLYRHGFLPCGALGHSMPSGTHAQPRYQPDLGTRNRHCLQGKHTTGSSYL